jgi:capsular exopolysaccharide synthesis family protein
VVMLELDLNNPTLSHKFGIENKVGISDYLNCRLDPEDIIRTVPEHENLFIIPSGPLPRNPSELIMSKRIEIILNYLNNIFDYIVIDTAPAGALTDAYILSKHCDVTLYIIRQKYTPKTLVEHLDDNNKTSRLNNVGIVFNGIRPRGFGKTNFGYGYSYLYSNKSKRKNNNKVKA